MMKIRIVDIASKAGVSPGTVDRIIHQRGKVSQKANEKVQRAIKELGYAPDILARNLALKKELRIVCLLPDPKDILYWQRPIAGIDKAIKELASFKFTIEKVYYAPRIEDFKQACLTVLDTRPNGVVYVPMFINESKKFSDNLRTSDIPFIQINIHHPEAQPLSFIGQNPIAAGKVAASLCQMALKDKEEILITYVSKNLQEYSHHQDRIEGFMQYFEKSNQLPPPIHHLHLKFDYPDINHEQLVIEHFKQHPHTQVIYVPNSRAYRIAAILKKHHIQDKMIVGFDTLSKNIAYLKEGYIRILIGQQSKAQGYNSVMFMFNTLFRKEKIKAQHYLPIDILNNQNIDFYEGLMQ